MLISNKFTLLNQLSISLVFNNGPNDIFTKNFVIKTNDVIDVSYNKDGLKQYIKGKIKEIGSTFNNSSLGRIESYVYIKIDGSDQYFGKTAYITPGMILDLNIYETTDTIVNPITTVDNANQKVFMVRENEIGQFQYSKDGITWKGAGEGEPGLSAYEVAIEKGFDGDEEEWLKSLQGKDGVLIDDNVQSTTTTWSSDKIFKETGKAESAYEIAVEHGFVGTEEEWVHSLKGINGISPYIDETTKHWFFNNQDSGYSAIPEEIVLSQEDRIYVIGYQNHDINDEIELSHPITDFDDIVISFCGYSTANHDSIILERKTINVNDLTISGARTFILQLISEEFNVIIIAKFEGNTKLKIIKSVPYLTELDHNAVKIFKVTGIVRH